MTDWPDNDDEYERAEYAAKQEAEKGRLLAVQVDGQVREVPCNFEGIRAGLNGATLTFVSGFTVGVYVDDEGLLNESALNIPASLMFGRALYGSVVLCAAQPDQFGWTLAPPEDAVTFMKGMADSWTRVVANARETGQEPFVRANADTVPPPRVVELDDAAMERWLDTGELPDG